MADDLREELRRRARWFYETQLRRLNCDSFRGVRPGQEGPLLDLISEPQLTAVFGQGPSGVLRETGRVYLDSGRPVWTDEEAARHRAFDDTLLGRIGDWLGDREPRRLAERLKALREKYEATPFASSTDPEDPLAGFPREHPAMPPDEWLPGEQMGQAIARAELAGQMPWLIPELYRTAGENTADPYQWVAALERHVTEFETELGLATGGLAGAGLPFDPTAPSGYRAALAALLKAATERRAGDTVEVRLIERSGDDSEGEGTTYAYRLSVGTDGAPMGPVTAYPLSRRVAYWSGVVHFSLRECVGLKPNSDMGLCQLVRLLYRYGPLPARFGAAASRWRTRTAPDDRFTRFVEARAGEKAVTNDPGLTERLRNATARLRIVLEETSANPLAPDPNWSPLAGEILKQGLLSYKFWMDERPRARDNVRLNKVKSGLGFGDEADREMEFWSENHYIMFASSEYLLGQLWEDETFQPCRLFADPDDRTGVRTGEQRRDRGRARVLKWLNSRLMFGWMEFHSSGYYREHLWALLNLVDFALDEEVQIKATMAVDLMLFDVARFLHRGTMGASGGRSQFKSKSHGFDNGLSDVVEILCGAKGVFVEGSSQIGASFASSTYTVPEVLLEIGTHPPEYPFTDRSRVSVTFDEAAKYGILWSQRSAAKDSLLVGYAPKRERHYPHLTEVNREIARTHDEYGWVEDDTVFFWGMSAFFNKQVVRNSLHVVHRFGLEDSEAFSILRKLIEIVLPVLKLPERLLPDLGLDGGQDELELTEESADDLSLVLEGSTRTRANILTHRSPGAMLSTVQNFRYGQLNFQSSVQQATLNGALNVFVTAGFAGLDISDIAAFGAGALVGGLVLGPLGAPLGGIGAVIANNELIEGTNPLPRADGPDWWTGYWALPRVVQHGGAAIMTSDFHDAQEFLAETGSHVWFPKHAFDQVVERRTSAYDDANFPLLDIGHIGAKGFWLFGKVVHPAPEGSPPEEGYVGVFSNKRPQWLTKETDPYPKRLEEKGYDEEAQEAFQDFFAGRDWYTDGKNVWIVQVGSRSEFGSFEAFMDRVASARIHLDDAGDLECTYDAPRPGGGWDRLRLASGGGGEFELNGGPLQTDLFPRFENPFVRGGLVEWGQRAYCLEWNQRSLLHDFTDFRRPVRAEQPVAAPGDAETIVALVIHLRTGDQAMETFTVATATVDVGCERLATDQVVAAGPVAEDTQHDAEWIFLDRQVRRSPDMAVSLTHPASGGEPVDLARLFGLQPQGLPIRPDLSAPFALPALDPASLLGPLAALGAVGDPEWKASYTLKALMGDWRLRECSVPFGAVDVKGDRRGTGPQPFAVRLSAWAEWKRVQGGIRARRWALARHPAVWLDHHDLLVLDDGGALWHRRTKCGMATGAWVRVEPSALEPAWAQPFSWAAASDFSGRAILTVVSEGRLLVRVSDQGGRWTGPWADLAPMTAGVIMPRPVPLGPGSVPTLVPRDDPFFGSADLYVTGADGDVYLRSGWDPEADGLWERLATDGFDTAPESPVGVAESHVVVRSTLGALWQWERDAVPGLPGSGGWTELGRPGYAVTRFAVASGGDELFLAATGAAGQVSLGRRRGGDPVEWVPATAEDDWRPHPDADVACVVPERGMAWALATGVDGTVRSASAEDGVWRRVGSAPGPSEVTGARRSRRQVAAVIRMPGQVEVFADTPDGALSWTWWS
ncbi:hypothetical protein [Streptomyces caniscabiei]|uniref:hypothetical protein n=1 Tax=Streptomyces caniscabiei TaxID=2746961 RepID=UPI0029A606E6|nr:hypothetical protein [Streptomyces caniscabiei]MDX3733373.1 hypothetical protein [Streptomyces caniscabiei]